MEAFFYVLRIMDSGNQIKRCESTDTGERTNWWFAYCCKLGLPLTELTFSFDRYINFENDIYCTCRRLEIFCFAAWDTKINDLHVLTNCSCSQDVLFQMQITNQLHLKGIYVRITSLHPTGLFRPTRSGSSLLSH